MKLSFCLYCGARSDLGNHDACRVHLERFREDLSRAPVRDRWMVFQAAEAGQYGAAPKQNVVPPKRAPGRPRKREPKAQKPRFAPYIGRAVELLNQGLLYREVLEVLNAEGYRSNQGNTIGMDLLRTRIYLLRKSLASQPETKPRARKGR